MNKNKIMHCPGGDVETIEFIFKSKINLNNYKPNIDDEVIFNNCSYIVIQIKALDYQTEIIFANKEQWYYAHQPYGG